MVNEDGHLRKLVQRVLKLRREAQRRYFVRAPSASLGIVGLAYLIGSSYWNIFVGQLPGHLFFKARLSAYAQHAPTYVQQMVTGQVTPIVISYTPEFALAMQETLKLIEEDLPLFYELMARERIVIIENNHETNPWISSGESLPDGNYYGRTEEGRIAIEKMLRITFRPEVTPEGYAATIAHEFVHYCLVHRPYLKYGEYLEEFEARLVDRLMYQKYGLLWGRDKSINNFYDSMISNTDNPKDHDVFKYQIARLSDDDMQLLMIELRYILRRHGLNVDEVATYSDEFAEEVIETPWQRIEKAIYYFRDSLRPHWREREDSEYFMAASEQLRNALKDVIDKEIDFHFKSGRGEISDNNLLL